MCFRQRNLCTCIVSRLKTLAGCHNSVKKFFLCCQHWCGRNEPTVTWVSESNLVQYIESGKILNFAWRCIIFLFVQRHRRLCFKTEDYLIEIYAQPTLPFGLILPEFKLIPTNFSLIQIIFWHSFNHKLWIISNFLK